MAGLGILTESPTSTEYAYKILVPEDATTNSVLDLSSYPAEAVKFTGVSEDSAVSSVEDFVSYAWSSGVISNGNLTKNLDGTVSIEAAEAALREAPSATARIHIVQLPAYPNIPLVDNSTNYIYADFNNGSPVFKVTTSIAGLNCMDKCVTWVVVREGTDLHTVDARAQNVDISTKTRRLFMDFSRFIHASGGSMLGASGLTISVTAGKFYFMTAPIPHASFNTSVPGVDLQNIFMTYHRDGLGGWTRTEGIKEISTTLYDDGSGTLALIGSNKFVVSWVFMLMNTPPALVVVYGQNEYSSLDAALLDAVPSGLPASLQGLGVLIGRVVFQSAATSFSAVESAFTSQFYTSAVSDHNSLSSLQGGGLNEYYHLTAAQYTEVTTKSFMDSFQVAKQNADVVTNVYTDGILTEQQIVEDNITTYTVGFTYSLTGELIEKTISRTLGGTVNIQYVYDNGILTDVLQVGGN